MMFLEALSMSQILKSHGESLEDYHIEHFLFSGYFLNDSIYFGAFLTSKTLIEENASLSQVLPIRLALHLADSTTPHLPPDTAQTPKSIAKY